ncbi:MAG: putative porin [Candidatus Riflebacteria bacterium]|nr:putative porin [Candidatus Riflebacteria bacterium]
MYNKNRIKTQNFKLIVLFKVIIILMAFPVQLFAESTLEELKAQVKELMNRVKVLETEKELEKSKVEQKEIGLVQARSGNDTGNIFEGITNKTNEKNTEKNSENYSENNSNNTSGNGSVKGVETKKENAGEKKSESWTDSSKVAGDYRVRYDQIYYPGWVPSLENYGRWRVRLRLGFDTIINKDTDFKVRFSTSEDRNVGMQGNPTSTNLTFTNVASKKPVFIDVGQLVFRSSDVKGLLLMLGKFETPFHAPGGTDLLWDRDLTLEGGAVKYENKNGDWNFSSVLGGFVLMERRNSNDSNMFGGQVAFKHTNHERKHNVVFGAGYYGFNRTKGRQVFDWQGENRNYGNTKNADNLYIYDYKEAECFVETTWEAGSVKRVMPVSLFGNIVKNLDSEVDDNKGWLLGVSVGKLSKPGDYAFKYDYRMLEKDAVVGAITDSDSLGGGTNGKGRRFSIERQTMKNVTLKASYFDNVINISDEDTNNRNYKLKRLQMEVQTKF